MAKPFDATTRELLESDPRAWLELLLGRELGDVRIQNADLSTITNRGGLGASCRRGRALACPPGVSVELRSHFAPAAPALQHPRELPTPTASAKHGTAPLS